MKDTFLITALVISGAGWVWTAFAADRLANLNDELTAEVAELQENEQFLMSDLQECINTPTTL